MVKTSFGKTIIRSYLHNKGRFLANFLTVLFSVAITGGLGALPETFADSFAEQYVTGNAPDLIVKSKAYTGFTGPEITEISSIEGVNESQSFFVFDGKEDDGTYNRFYVFDFEQATIAKPELLEGRYPTSRGEIVVEQPTKNRKAYAINDTVTFAAANMFMPAGTTIVGIVHSPLYSCVAKERAELEDQNDKQYVEGIFYLEKSTLLKFTQNMCSDIYLRVDTSAKLLTNAYKGQVEQIKKRILNTFGEDNVAVLTLEETTSYGLFRGYNDKVRLIGYIFPFFFILVCALINHITMTRYIKDERAVIGTYLSNGVSKAKIVNKYVIFAGISVFSGGVIGYLLGTPLLPFVVYPAYNAVFQMSPATVSFLAPVGIGVIGVLLLLALFITAFSAISYVRHEPSEIMREPTPAAGKKILLERIKFLWKPLPFSFKSTFRNIFRQKKNFILTSLAVIGSSLLVLIGFSLLNVSDALKQDELFSEVASSMGLISAVIVAFAIAMALPIIYALASMNIADRNRELATLKVLGYHDIECSMYTFREILIITLMAALIALPISALVIDAVLRYLEFGSITDVQWWSYLSTFLLITTSMVAVNFMLLPRIKAIDMNASLKSNE